MKRNGARTAPHRPALDCVRMTFPGPHVLWTVGKVVRDPGGAVVIHPRALQLVPQKHRLDGFKATGDIKKNVTLTVTLDFSM